MSNTEVVVPLKAFTAAKQRLSVEPKQRVELMKRMASSVLTSTTELDTWVVCDDGEVRDWALAAGFSVLVQPAAGLSEAVQLSVDRRFIAGVDRVIVAHGDLPLLNSLEHLATLDGVAAVPGLEGLGTKVLSVPAGHGFRFNYGPTSAADHRAEARRCGLTFRTVQDPAIGLDINTLDDLRRLEREHPGTFSRLTGGLGIFDDQREPMQGRSS